FASLAQRKRIYYIDWGISGDVLDVDADITVKDNRASSEPTCVRKAEAHSRARIGNLWASMTRGVKPPSIRINIRVPRESDPQEGMRGEKERTVMLEVEGFKPLSLFVRKEFQQHRPLLGVGYPRRSSQRNDDIARLKVSLAPRGLLKQAFNNF